jgi:hypothetical protein
MKDRVDKSMGIVTLIVETLDKINPNETLRFAKREITRNETVQIPQVILRSKY